MCQQEMMHKSSRVVSATRPIFGFAAVSVARLSKTYFISFDSFKEGGLSVITDLQGPSVYTILTYLTKIIIIIKYEA